MFTLTPTPLRLPIFLSLAQCGAGAERTAGKVRQAQGNTYYLVVKTIFNTHLLILPNIQPYFSIANSSGTVTNR